jgi:hypothetical protein
LAQARHVGRANGARGKLGTLRLAGHLLLSASMPRREIPLAARGVKRASVLRPRIATALCAIGTCSCWGGETRQRASGRIAQRRAPTHSWRGNLALSDRRLDAAASGLGLVETHWTWKRLRSAAVFTWRDRRTTARLRTSSAVDSLGRRTSLLPRGRPDSVRKRTSEGRAPSERRAGPLVS